MDSEIILKTGDESCLSDIRELWEELNQLHLEKSPDFKPHYRALTFQSRRESLLAKAEKGKLSTIIAYHNEMRIGYCVSSIVDDAGEIDSIYVKADYRKRLVGTMLMESSLNWLEENGVTSISVAVSVGNEEVFGFYAKYGFKPRLTILQLNS